MSVQHLKEALARQPPQKGVVVSEPLFYKLREAGEIKETTEQFPLPTDELARRIGELLGQRPAAHIEYQVYTLRNHGDALVARDTEMGILLADNGRNSFQIR